MAEKKLSEAEMLAYYKAMSMGNKEMLKRKPKPEKKKTGKKKEK